MSNGMNRRRLLHLTGLASGSLFLPSLLGGKAARAATPPKRLVINFTQHGPHYMNWAMRDPGLPDASADWEFSLVDRPENQWSPILKPLYRHRKKLLVVDGLALTSAFAEPTRTNNHNMGTAHALTGALMGKGGYGNDGTGGDSSIDQIVADEIAVPGRLHSLQYKTGYAWPSFFKERTELGGEQDPAKAYQRLFAGAAPPGTSAQPDLLATGRADLLAAVRDEFAAVSPRLSGEDRRKLQAHLALVEDLQKRVMAPQVACTGPRGGYDVDPNDRQKRFEAFVPLIAAALSCDMTRVVGLNKAQWKPSEFGVNAGDTHQDIAHSASPGSTGAAAQGMTKYYAKEAEHFAQLLDALDAVPEGDGTLLDNSCVLWACELGNGIHDLYRLMFVIAGSASGHFKTGRYLKYAETVPPLKPSWYGSGKGQHGPPHSKLLIAVLQAMGLARDSLPVKMAGSVDLSGPLPRLRA